MTLTARGLALEAEQGEHYVASGRRSGIKQMFANIVESLGPTAVTAIGSLIIVYLVYRTFKRFSNPAKDIIYT